MGLIFDIKRYSINDGPGIRVTVFFKGCPLRCLWCHNPEGISAGKEKLYTKSKCISCGICVGTCEYRAVSLIQDGEIVFDDNRCAICGKCAEACPSKAIEISGRQMSVDFVVGEIVKEITAMDQSGGGVTFCGGEPLMHHKELLELLVRCGDMDIHRAVDTSLYVNAEILKKVLIHTDLFLVDIKHMDSIKHRRFCGVDNELILANIRLLSEYGSRFHVRIPLIEGVNTDEDNIMKTAQFLDSLIWEDRRVEILPYHDIGMGKHQKMGTVYNPDNLPMSAPSVECVHRVENIFALYGIKAYSH